MPELSVGVAEFATMRRACLLYLADHGDVDAIRHDVVSIVVVFCQQPLSRRDCGGNPGPNRNRKEAACTAPSRERSR